MKVMFELVTLLFSLTCVNPVFMYYIYDDNPIAGYVSNTNEIGTYAKGRVSGHKKYLVSTNNQKSMKLVNERAVDSHFKISKASPISFASVLNTENHTPKIRKGTDPPKQKNVVEHNSGAPKLTLQNGDIKNSEQLKVPVLNDVQKHINEGLFKPNVRNYFENLNVFNKLHNKDVVSHKSYTAIDTQKNFSKINNKRPYSPQNYYQKTLASSVKDKVLHKANINNEQNAQLMKYMLNEIAQKFLDRKSQKQGEYRKRDAIPNDTVHQKAADLQENKGNHKDKYISRDIVKRGRAMTPRIGSYDLGVEINDTPYALFYRMNHENIEQSDFFPSAKDRRTTGEEPINAPDKHTITMPYPDDNARTYRRSVNARNINNHYTVFRDR